MYYGRGASKKPSEFMYVMAVLGTLSFTAVILCVVVTQLLMYNNSYAMTVNGKQNNNVNSNML